MLNDEQGESPIVVLTCDVVLCDTASAVPICFPVPRLLAALPPGLLDGVCGVSGGRRPVTNDFKGEGTCLPRTAPMPIVFSPRSVLLFTSSFRIVRSFLRIFGWRKGSEDGVFPMRCYWGTHWLSGPGQGGYSNLQWFQSYECRTLFAYKNHFFRVTACWIDL